MAGLSVLTLGPRPAPAHREAAALLAAFLGGELPPREAARVKGHAERCPDCRRLLAAGERAAEGRRHSHRPSRA